MDVQVTANNAQKSDAVSHWRALGTLMGLPEVRSVVASPDRFGLIGATAIPTEDVDPGSGTRAESIVVRVTDSTIDVVHECPGFVEFIDGVGDLWAALRTEIVEGDVNHVLLISLDAGQHWGDAGRIPLSSVSGLSVSTVGTVLVHSSATSCVSADEGRTWVRGELPSPPTGAAVRVIRDGVRLALSGRGGMRFSEDFGHTWSPTEMGHADVHDLHEGLVLGRWTGVAGIAQLGAGAPHIHFPERFPLRLTGHGLSLQVLTRGLEPADGPDLRLHRSQDAGSTWTYQTLGLSPRCDISGADWGLGTDLVGRIHIASS